MNRHKPTNQRRSAKKASKLSVENIRQYITLFKVKLLENLPIRQLNVNNLEADDVIAELTRVYKDDNVIIISKIMIIFSFMQKINQSMYLTK